MEQARAQPARLLQARHQLVTFTGRADELRRLADWRDGRDPVSVLLLHGAGGQGKTRLATQFAEASRGGGWQVLQARHISDPAPLTAGDGDGYAGVSPGAGVLVVADYAERWPVTDLLELLTDAARQGARTRVLLAARPAGAWWQPLANRLDRIGVSATALALPSLTDDRDTGPEQLFVDARDHFAAALDVPGTGSLTAPTAVLAGDPGLRHVLAVHMAALAAVDRHRRATRTDPAEHARLHNSLATRQAYAGMYGQALAAAEQAVAIRRRLAAEDAAAYEPDLAASNHLAQVGRRGEALASEEEAVAIRRRMAGENEAAYGGDLARSLSNLGIHLAKVGRADEARAVAGEAAAHARAHPHRGSPAELPARR